MLNFIFERTWEDIGMEEEISKCDILLINPPYHRRIGSGIVPPLGLAYLCSSLINANFNPEVLDCSLVIQDLFEDSLRKLKIFVKEQIKSLNPKYAIGIGPCTTATLKAIIEIINACNEVCPYKPIIMGGPLTLIPQIDWLFFDKLKVFAVIKGDGESRIVELLSRMKHKQEIKGIQGIQTQKKENVVPYFERNLNNLLFPTWDKFVLKSYKPSIRRDLFYYPFVPVIGSRGCYFDCSFCFSGQCIKYRKRRLSNIIEEIRFLVSKYDIQSIIFYDDCLFINNKKINPKIVEFSNSIGRISDELFWQFEIRPDLFSKLDVETTKTLYENGCRQINLGIENVSQKNLEFLNKEYSVDLVKEKSDMIRKYVKKLRLTGTFIFGGPYETENTIRNTIEYSTKLNLLYAHFYPLEIYPGTPLYDIYVDNKKNIFWYEEILQSDKPWGEIIYESKELPINKLFNFINLAYKSFYERKDWLNLAKFLLKENFESVLGIINHWKKNRFNIEV